MKNCPVCNNVMNNETCSNCGYDMSCDYEAYPSLMQIDTSVIKTKSVLITERSGSKEKETASACPRCGYRIASAYGKGASLKTCPQCGYSEAKASANAAVPSAQNSSTDVSFVNGERSVYHMIIPSSRASSDGGKNSGAILGKEETNTSGSKHTPNGGVSFVNGVESVYHMVIPKSYSSAAEAASASSEPQRGINEQKNNALGKKNRQRERFGQNRPEWLEPSPYTMVIPTSAAPGKNATASVNAKQQSIPNLPARRNAEKEQKSIPQIDEWDKKMLDRQSESHYAMVNKPAKPVEKCSRCGLKIDPNYKGRFCPECGTVLKTGQNAAETMASAKNIESKHSSNGKSVSDSAILYDAPFAGPFIAAGWNHVIAVRKDGTVIASGSNYDKQCDVSGWRHVVAVAAGSYHSVGLTMEGRVLATGDNEYGQCNVGDWSGIVAVCAYDKITTGVTAEGRVKVAGHFCDIHGEMSKRLNEVVESWTDIRMVAMGYECCYGIKKNGSVVMAEVELETVKNYTVKNYNVKLTDVVSIDSDSFDVAILDKNGSVWKSGNQFNSVEKLSWSGIVSVAAGKGVIVGVTKEGKVVYNREKIFMPHKSLRKRRPWSKILKKEFVPFKSLSKLKVWSNIAYVCVAAVFEDISILGLTNDGTIVQLGNKEKAYDQAISKMKDIRTN